MSFYDDGSPGELFISGAHVGSDADALLSDAAVLISRALQHGDSLHDLAKAMGREGDKDTSSSAIGIALDAGVQILDSLPVVKEKPYV